jgi:hypothetical protein
MIGLLSFVAAVVAAPVPAPLPGSAETVQVMVLGTYHFDNPGLDKVNVKVDDVTVPRRQRELEALAEAIATFKPTRVMVESRRPGPAYDVTPYHNFTPDMLTKTRDETVQLGYRIAAKMKLPSVQGIDEQPGKDGPDYFPFGPVENWAKAHGRKDQLDAMIAEVQAGATRTEHDLPTMSIPAMLLRYNDENSPTAGQGFYYNLLRFGDSEQQPGAVLNAMWYMRNAKIFGKLIDVARPGDRVLVIYGAGHGYWLRHFAATTPGYRLVDVKPYLKRAAGIK